MFTTLQRSFKASSSALYQLRKEEEQARTEALQERRLTFRLMFCANLKILLRFANNFQGRNAPRRAASSNTSTTTTATTNDDNNNHNSDKNKFS